MERRRSSGSTPSGARTRRPVQRDDLRPIGSLASRALANPDRAGAALGTEDVLSLQRSAGNKATTSLLAAARMLAADLAPSVDEAGGSSRATAGGAAGIRPALDADKEAEADRVADAAVRRMGAGAGGRRDVSPFGAHRGVAQRSPERPAAGTSGGRGIPARLASALRPEVGSVDHLRLDSSEQAAREAGSIGARAFASGDRLAFGRGELDLSSPSGMHLAAHEVAHARLHGSAGRQGESQLVHAKLRGTAQAAEQQGGGRSTKGLRKLVGMKTNWDKILDGLGAYEQLEEEVLAKGNLTPKAVAMIKPRLLEALVKVEASLLSWQDANDEAGEGAKAEQRFDKLSQDTYDNAEVDRQRLDKRSKAARRQTVAMLLPRVRTEMSDLNSGSWASTLGLSPEKVSATGREDKGQMANVKELTYKTENGEFSGFFKQETGYFDPTRMAGRDVLSGIRLADPNYGARSMAMYRLDRLLEAGVTARVEWAVHDGKMGVVTESAAGTKASDVRFGSETKPGQVSYDDATLQRCLNRLQILDAIALQLDRHQGNYYVQSDDRGNVTGVTGIDLDMSFGRNAKRPEDAPEESWSYAYRGLPPEIDEAFGQKILSVSEDAVRGAITGLLHPEEVESTVARFRHVQGVIRTAQEQGALRKDWGRQSGGTTAPDKLEALLTNDKKGTSTYTDAVRGGGVGNDVAQMLESSVEPELNRHMDGLPKPTVDAYRKALIGNVEKKWLSERGFLYGLAAASLAARALPVGKVEEAMLELVHEMFLGPGATFEVGMQEEAELDTLKANLQDALRLLWSQIVSRHQQSLVNV